MEWLAERFSAVQDALLNLIEQGAEDLESQIQYWTLVRKENVMMYYGRKEGLTKIGLQPLPLLAVSEYNAKQAIHLMLLLRSLQKSPYARERWTLQDASAELINTQPKDCFKKQPYTVEVYFDNNKNNTFTYINWDFIYYQDSEEHWHKVPGLVDYNGLYYQEIGGDQVYFTLFDTDAHKYGQKGYWTVVFKNETLIAPVTSSSKPSSSISGQTFSSSISVTPEDTVSTSESPRRLQKPEVGSSTEKTSTRRRRRRQQQREHSPESSTSTPAKRRRSGGRGGGSILSSVPAPEEVGTRNRSVPRTGLSRLRRLEEEAWDPPILIIAGPANPLKCWRYRKGQQNVKCLAMSTIFTWVGDESNADERGRMLVAFRDTNERADFVKHLQLPKHASFAFGSLDRL